MSETVCEVQDVHAMTKESLSQSPQALAQLKEQCIAAGNSLLINVAQGAIAVINAAEQLHDFIIYEQEVVHIYDIDATTITDGEMTLKDAEIAMQEMLDGFTKKLDEMDLVGISTSMTQEIPPIIDHFIILLQFLQEKIDDTYAG